MGYYDNYLIDNPSCVIVGVQATAARMSQDGHLRERPFSMSSAKGKCSALSPSRMRFDLNPDKAVISLIVVWRMYCRDKAVRSLKDRLSSRDPLRPWTRTAVSAP
jgi:hypothetical protein